MQRQLEPAAAIIKDLAAMHIAANAQQARIDAYFTPVPRECAAGGMAD